MHVNLVKESVTSWRFQYSAMKMQLSHQKDATSQFAAQANTKHCQKDSLQVANLTSVQQFSTKELLQQVQQQLVLVIS